MIKVNVKDLDELIRLSKKYWKTGDVDILTVRRAIQEKLLTRHFLELGLFN